MTEFIMTNQTRKGISGILEFLYIFIAFSIWIIVNLKFGVLSGLIQDASLEGSGVTPILTYATYPSSIISFLYVSYKLQHNKYVLLYAISVPIFAIAVFEVLWHFVGVFAVGFPYAVNMDGYIILASWAILGTISFKFWGTSVLTILVLIAYITLWFAWLFDGYPQIVYGSYTAYFFNLLLKIMTFILVMSLFVKIRKGGTLHE